MSHYYYSYTVLSFVIFIHLVCCKFNKHSLVLDTVIPSMISFKFKLFSVKKIISRDLIVKIKLFQLRERIHSPRVSTVKDLID